MNPVLKQLVLKDVKLNLPIMALMAAAGLLALLVMQLGKTGYAVGGILYITANIAGAIFVGMYCVVQERKDQSTLFALSLPISVRELNTLKFVSALAIYTAPWLLLTAVVAVAHVVRPDIPHGMVVYSALLQGSFIAIAYAYFALISVSRSDAVAGFSILFLNMGFSLFMVWSSQPAIQDPMHSDRIQWTTPAITAITVEIAVVAAAVAIGFLCLSRRREFF